MDPSIDDQLYFLNHTQPYNALFDAAHNDAQPHALDDEPLYVNAKQYFRILKRRVARSRLDEVHRLSRQRKPYLHESRHKHAMRRPRGPGGRFLTAEEIAAQKRSEAGADAADGDKDDGADDDSPTPDAVLEPGPSTDPRQQQQQHQQDIPRMQTPIIDQHHDSFFQPDPASFRAPSIPVQQQQQQIPHISSHSHSHSHPHQHSHAPPSHQHHQQSGHHQHQGHHARPHIRHPHSPPKSANSGPYPFQSPIPSQYTPPPQMHHVPHPHAHARHHHSNPMYWPDPMSPDMTRRNDENMIQFGGQGPN